MVLRTKSELIWADDTKTFTKSKAGNVFKVVSSRSSAENSFLHEVHSALVTCAVMHWSSCQCPSRRQFYGFPAFSCRVDRVLTQHGLKRTSLIPRSGAEQICHQTGIRLVGGWWVEDRMIGDPSGRMDCFLNLKNIYAAFEGIHESKVCILACSEWDRCTSTSKHDL